MTALVTGASSGIGAAAAIELARRGATVGICARRADRLAETYEACREHGAETHMWVIDLADHAGLDAFAQQVITEMGGLDILVNNAGSPKRRRMQEITPEEFESAMGINFTSPMRLTLAVLPHMLERDSGFIVNVSSSGTRKLCAGVGAYVAAKAALDHFTEALYLDLAGTGVQARLLIPGSTATEFSTEREGNNPPFRLPPDAYEAAEVVAAAIVDCMAGEDLEYYPSDEETRVSTEKRADFNGYLRKGRAWLATG